MFPFMEFFKARMYIINCIKSSSFSFLCNILCLIAFFFPLSFPSALIVNVSRLLYAVTCRTTVFTGLQNGFLEIRGLNEGKLPKGVMAVVPVKLCYISIDHLSYQFFGLQSNFLYIISFNLHTVLIQTWKYYFHFSMCVSNQLNYLPIMRY